MADKEQVEKLNDEVGVETEMDTLGLLFRDAQAQNLDVALELTVPTCEETEIIIVKNKNLEYNLVYYKENYNENLELIRFPEIKIVNMKMGEFANII